MAKETPYKMRDKEDSILNFIQSRGLTEKEYTEYCNNSLERTRKMFEKYPVT